jgi:hypothetical protein
MKPPFNPPPPPPNPIRAFCHSEIMINIHYKLKIFEIGSQVLNKHLVAGVVLSGFPGTSEKIPIQHTRLWLTTRISNNETTPNHKRNSPARALCRQENVHGGVLW